MELEVYYALSLLDWSETHTYVEKKCKEILDEEEMESNDFVTVEDYVDILINKINSLKEDKNFQEKAIHQNLSHLGCDMTDFDKMPVSQFSGRQICIERSTNL